MRETKLSNLLWRGLIVLGFVFLFAPSYFYYSTAAVRFVFSNGQYVFGALFILLSLFYRIRTINRIEIMLIVYYLILIVSTFLNHNPVSAPIQEMINILGNVSLIMFAAERHPKALYNGIYDVLVIYALVNLLTIFLYPNGMYSNRSVSYLTRNWLLGYDNQHVNYLLPMILLGLLRDAKYGKYRYGLFAFILSITTVLVTKSSASLIAFAVMIIPVFMGFLKNNKLMQLNKVLYVIFALEIVMIVIGNISFLAPVIRFFGKSETLSGRVRIWQLTSMRIFQKPILGWGLMSYDRRLAYFSTYPIAALHAHNRLMEVMYMGGACLLAVYVIVLLMCASGLKKMENKSVAFALTMTITAYLIGMLTEYYGSARLFFPMLALCCHGFADFSIRRKRKLFKVGKKLVTLQR